jgi:hypothetical protein
VGQKNGTGAVAEERVGRAMAQLQLEAKEDEPDSTVIGKVLSEQRRLPGHDQ